MSDSPYSPPVTDLDPQASLSSSSKWVARLGVLLFTGPVCGIVGTAISMVRAFDTLSENDSSSAHQLSGEISAALWSTMIGMLAGLVGAILILVALLVLKNREFWFFWCSVILAAIWGIIAFPLGLVPAGIVALLFWSKKSEFLMGAQESR